MPREAIRRVCFVTGTRAEFGLMRCALEAIRTHPRLRLQLIVTGMHLQRSCGHTIDDIRGQGWPIDAVVPWPASGDSAAQLARLTGLAQAGIATALERLRSDIVLVVGDRVEAFAAASAGHVGQRIVAHVHGGDRAEGVIDDSLRHAITKLSHLHFAATRDSARRIARLGEEAFRIHVVGSPGLDQVRRLAAPWAEVGRRLHGLKRRKFALLVQHPSGGDRATEARRARLVLDALLQSGIEQVVTIAPNNDPGAAGILETWRANAHRMTFLLDSAPRPLFLALMGEAAVMVGNSSSGIIEAATFGTPVLNIGDRQRGRLRSGNVIDVACRPGAIRAGLARIRGGGRGGRARVENVYGRGGAGRRIADILGRIPLDERLRRKLIAY